jgi:chromosome partitioning protein
VIITIVNQKGGVGKTTTAVNLSYLISKTSKCALIDLDPEGGSTVSFGLRRELRDLPLFTYYVNIFGLDLYPSHIGLLKAELNGNVEEVKKSLYNLSNSYDIVVVDTPPNLGTLSISAMLTADKIMAPVTPQPLVIEASRNLDFRLQTIKKKAKAFTNFSKKPIELNLQNIEFLPLAIPSSKIFVEASKLGIPALRYEEVKIKDKKIRKYFEELFKAILNE